MSGSTALHMTAVSDNAVCTEVLIRSGANENEYNSDALTPLEVAVMKQNCGQIKVLVEQNANREFLYAKDQAIVDQCMKSIQNHPIILK